MSAMTMGIAAAQFSSGVDGESDLYADHLVLAFSDRRQTEAGGLQGEIRHALWEYNLTLNASRCRFGAGRMEMDDMLIVCLIEAIVGSAR